MKLIFSRAFFTLFIAHCSLLIVYAQWQPDIRITNDPASSRTSGTNVKCIAAAGDTVHICWSDMRDGNPEIYYARSTNGGQNWSANTRLTNSEGSSGLPALVISGPNLYMVWDDYRDGNGEIYYKNSTNAGVSWGPDIRLTNFNGASNVPSIALSGQLLHVAWVDYRGGPPKVYYKRSTDGGGSWGPDTLLVAAPPTSICPSITASGLTVHAAWMDTRNGNDEIYYKRSTNGGISWQADTRISFYNPISLGPCIISNGNVIHLAWSEPYGLSQVFYKRSTNGGVNWLADTILSNTAYLGMYPSLAVSGVDLHLVWTDYRSSNFEIYYKGSTNAGISWSAETRLSNYPATSEFGHIAVSGHALHVVWSENYNGNWEIYYKQNPSGNPVYAKNTGSDIPKEFALFQNYPNPFNPSTKIKFALPPSPRGEGLGVRLIIYDVLGREVAVLVNEAFKPGVYEVDWEASLFPGGVYYYKLISSRFTNTRKMILIK